MKIAVVGGGPAGSCASYLLAKKGAEVLLFDHKIPWEKPCGGGITWKGIKSFTFLQEAALNPFIASEVEFISPEDKHQIIPLENPIYVFSRKELSRYLLKMTEDSGVIHLREKVRKIRESTEGWEIVTSERSCKSRLLIGADGSHSLVRRTLGNKLDKNCLSYSLSALVKDKFEGRVIIKFVNGLSGYLWIFPRKEVTSIGICSDLASLDRQKIKKTFIQFFAEKYNYPCKGLKLQTAVLPIVSKNGLENNKISGERWALIGDAAGFADPIMGEGNYYALRSAELLVESINGDSVHQYPVLLEKDFLPQLVKSAQLKPTFYSPQFLKRMFFYLNNSPNVRRIAAKVMEGEIGYLELKRKLLSISPRVGVEVLITSIKRLFSFR